MYKMSYCECEFEFKYEAKIKKTVGQKIIICPKCWAYNWKIIKINIEKQ